MLSGASTSASCGARVVRPHLGAYPSARPSARPTPSSPPWRPSCSHLAAPRPKGPHQPTRASAPESAHLPTSPPHLPLVSSQAGLTASSTSGESQMQRRNQPGRALPPPHSWAPLLWSRLLSLAAPWSYLPSRVGSYLPSRVAHRRRTRRPSRPAVQSTLWRSSTGKVPSPAFSYLLSPSLTFSHLLSPSLTFSRLLLAPRLARWQSPRRGLGRR